MNKKEKILISIITILCPPVGLVSWLKLNKLQEQYIDELNDICTYYKNNM